MKWLALGLGLLLSILGNYSGNDNASIMGTVWMATSFVLASIDGLHPKASRTDFVRPDGPPPPPSRK